jgi:hypothetical protein
LLLGLLNGLPVLAFILGDLRPGLIGRDVLSLGERVGGPVARLLGLGGIARDRGANSGDGGITQGSWILAGATDTLLD